MVIDGVARIFELVEGWFGKKKTATVQEAVDKYEVATGEKVEGKENIVVEPKQEGKWEAK